MRKFIAFIFDWDENDSLTNPSVLPMASNLSGVTWKSGYVHATVPNAAADIVGFVLKRSTVLDRHLLTVIDTMSKLKHLKFTITVVTVAYDEIAAML